MDAETMAALGRLVLAALRAREIEKAAALVAEAVRRKEATSFSDRARVVTDINRCILAAKVARDNARAEAAKLPGVSPLDVEHRVIAPLDRLFEREIDELRRQKRQASRPG